MSKKDINIFKLGGSYLGLFASFIFILQIRVFRVLFLEGVAEDNYFCNLCEGIPCNNLLLAFVFLFLVMGFVVGGFCHKKKVSST